jgi:hypothetical protein
MENRLTHQFVKNEDVVLFFKIFDQRTVQIVFKKRTLSNQRVNLLFFNFETNSINQHRNFDGVELIDHRVKLGFFVM